MSASKPQSKNGAEPKTIESAVELGQKAVALKKWEDAVQYYSQALELISAKHGEEPRQEDADVYFSYGRALLETAINSNSVLGNGQGDEPEDAVEPVDSKAGSSKTSSNPRFHFGEDEDEEEAVDLLGDAAQAAEEEERAEQEEPDDEGEPEDDFNAAWEVLDVARTLFEKQAETDDFAKLKLADTYMLLGDISLETEKFDRAILDFEAGIQLKEELFPLASRHIAEAHYKLGMALDLTSGRLKDAVEHTQRAKASIEARMAELKVGLQGQQPSAAAKPISSSGPSKGKGKAPAQSLRKDLVETMSRSEIEQEVNELSGILEELELKLEELSNAPEGTARELLEKELNPSFANESSGAAANAPVNDLTGVVKRKKVKPAEANGEASGAGVKRKADDDQETSLDVSTSKKARVEEVPDEQA
ncbi:hypothetical protein BKA62DRAFT_760842 [Auriculariales sp. MPI-PUGE-AT-0066]|nr:hypothetical protein BKA62DRAFT_760842 [Auriculariales sp. MPI-PUGE-AT-0066]